MRWVPAFSGIWFVSLGKQHYTTIHAWGAVEQQPELPFPPHVAHATRYVPANKTVDALRPEAKRLLICSCDECKQLQKMPMGISLQHSSECSVLVP